MGNRRSKELNSCVKGELIELKFSGVDQMYCALLSEAEYHKYEKNFSSVKRNYHTSPVYFRVSGDADKLYIIHDLDGRDVGKNSGWVRRFAPSFTPSEAQGIPPIGTSYVKNAHDTEASESMIQHWKSNQSKSSKLDLNNYIRLPFMWENSVN